MSQHSEYVVMHPETNIAGFFESRAEAEAFIDGRDDFILLKVVPVEPEPREVELSHPYAIVTPTGGVRYTAMGPHENDVRFKTASNMGTPVRLRAFALDEPAQEKPTPALDWYVRKPNGLVDGPHPPDHMVDTSSMTMRRIDSEPPERTISFPRGTRVSADGVPEWEWPRVCSLVTSYPMLGIRTTTGIYEEAQSITTTRRAALALLRERIDAELARGDIK